MFFKQDYENLTHVFVDGQEYGVLSFKNENGEEWIDFIQSLSPHTLKILVDENNYIVQASYDAYTLKPDALYFYEISQENIPENFTDYGLWNWKYVNGTIVIAETIDYMKELNNIIIDITYYRMIGDNEMIGKLSAGYIELYEKYLKK